MATPHHPQIQKMIPLSEAASRFNRPELPQLVNSGTIGASMYNDVILVSEVDAMAELPKTERPEYKKHAHLAGVGIGMREAERKYSLRLITISRWVQKGFIRVIGKANKQKTLLDEADMAYCAEVYNENPGSGKRIFNTNGTPYTKKS